VHLEHLIRNRLSAHRCELQLERHGAVPVAASEHRIPVDARVPLERPRLITRLHADPEIPESTLRGIHSWRGGLAASARTQARGSSRRFSHRCEFRGDGRGHSEV